MRVMYHVERDGVYEGVDGLDDLRQSWEAGYTAELTSSPFWPASQFFIAKLPLMKSF